MAMGLWEAYWWGVMRCEKLTSLFRPSAGRRSWNSINDNRTSGQLLKRPDDKRVSKLVRPCD